MKEPNPDETFKVVDRRHFTPEGDLRQGVPEQEEPAQKPRANASSAPEKSAGTNASSTTQQPSPAPEESKQEAPGRPPSSQGFQMLVDLLARNAAAYLGGVADPRTGQAFLDLEGAREVIDMMDTLREKTMGNLSVEDEQLLIEVLGSLKLSFMEVSRAAAAAQAKSKGKS